MSEEELRTAVRQSLEEFWDARALPAAEGSGSLDDLVDPLDSLTAVDALLDIEEIVDLTIPEGEVIRRGGYDTRGQFIDHLSQRVVRYVMKKTIAGGE